MKLTKQQLKQLIKEELQKVLYEQDAVPAASGLDKYKRRPGKYTEVPPTPLPAGKKCNLNNWSYEECILRFRAAGVRNQSMWVQSNTLCTGYSDKHPGSTNACLARWRAKNCVGTGEKCQESRDIWQSFPWQKMPMTGSE